MTLRTYRLACAVAAILLVLPVFITVRSFYYGSLSEVYGNPPAVIGSDEEHYMVMINSIVRDGDLDLKNNYLQSHRGSDDGGRIYAGLFYGHHSLWIRDGYPVHWTDALIIRDLPGGAIETRFKQGLEDLAPKPEYSWHPYSFAMLMAGPAWAFRSLVTEETTSLLVMTLTGVLSFLLLNGIFARLGFGYGQRFALSLAAFLTTPWWHYSRTLYTEGMIACFETIAIYLWFRGRDQISAGWAGLPLGLSCTFKPPLVVTFLPFLADWAGARKFRPLFLAGLLGALCLALLLTLNAILFGSPLVQNPAEFIPISQAWSAMFLGVRQGIFWSCPTFFLAFYGFYRAFREDRRAFTVLGGGFFSYWGVLLFLHNWYGGGQYGPRYIVPIVPHACVAIGYAWRALYPRGRWARALLFGVLAVAVIPNVFAALYPMLFIKLHPWELIANWLFGWEIPPYTGG